MILEPERKLVWFSIFEKIVNTRATMKRKKEEREESGEEKRVRISGRKKEEMCTKMRRGNERGRVRDTHASEYEEILRFSAVWTGTSLPTFLGTNCSHLQR
jgi:hypothetical protein